jgi:hypothetical protein
MAATRSIESKHDHNDTQNECLSSCEQGGELHTPPFQMMRVGEFLGCSLSESPVRVTFIVFPVPSLYDLPEFGERRKPVGITHVRDCVPQWTDLTARPSLDWEQLEQVMEALNVAFSPKGNGSRQLTSRLLILV